MSSKSLYEELGEKNDSDSRRYIENLDTLRQIVGKIWQRQKLGKFTGHGIDHILQVEKNLFDLTRPLLVTSKALSSEEVYILLAGCYLHDIALQYDLADVRRKHPEYAYDLIRKGELYKDGVLYTLDLDSVFEDDTNARLSTAFVAKAHWTDFAVSDEGPEEITELSFQNRGRIRLLGVLLALADLLDLSPMRATYFRSIHHSDKPLPAESDLHQTMHSWVQGFEIGPEKKRIPQRLQYRLKWHSDDPIVHTTSDWVMQWFSSQWRRLGPKLELLSEGAIQWATPWAVVNFRSPQVILRNLGSNAESLLLAERQEQMRIDREEIIQRFRSTIDNSEQVLFVFPTGTLRDGLQISNWCQHYVHDIRELRLASISMPQTCLRTLSEVKADILDQWGSEPTDAHAQDSSKAMKTYLTRHYQEPLMLILRTEVYEEKLIRPLLSDFYRPIEGLTRGTRVCLLLTRGSPKNERARSAVHYSTGGVFDEILPTKEELLDEDVRDHVKKYTRLQDDLPVEGVEHFLSSKWGYDADEIATQLSAIEESKMLQFPGRLNSYINELCIRGSWKQVYYT